MCDSLKSYIVDIIDINYPGFFPYFYNLFLTFISRQIFDNFNAIYLFIDFSTSKSRINVRLSISFYNQVFHLDSLVFHSCHKKRKLKLKKHFVDTKQNRN